jgi:hypothetical protein
MITPMHSKLQSLVKRWYCLTASPSAAKEQWQAPYWQESNGIRDIPFGKPLRKCVVAAIEAHLHDSNGLNVLELGFGRFSLARNLIRRSGGIWTGVEPRLPKTQSPSIGHGGYGHAADIPFPDEIFDRVFGIQSLEHWGQKAYTAV